MNTTGRNWTRIVRLCALILTLGLALGGSGAAMAGPASEAPAAVSRETPSAATTHSATPAEIAKYASRDKKASKELRQFAGGDVLVVGASAVVLILLIVLIVLLVR
jgi:hypothetical protein